jgi:hypothetical protein
LKDSGHEDTSKQAVGIDRLRPRRRSAAFRTEAVAACQQPGVSVAAVAWPVTRCRAALGAPQGVFPGRLPPNKAPMLVIATT